MKTSYEAKEDSGNLFRLPDDQIKSEKHPTYEGEFKVRCTHCGQASTGWLKGWIKEAKNGSKFFSLAFKHRQRRDAA
jgi:hypothetical protein